MACFYPVHGKRQEGGEIAWAPGAVPDGWGRHESEIVRSCGQCHGCRLERARQWAIRLLHERRIEPKCRFITLTYDNEHIPWNGSLDKEHVQLFFKRLRRERCTCRTPKTGKKAKVCAQPTVCGLRYYAVGEYGERTLRPHYHAIVYGADWSEDQEQVGTGKHGDPLFRSEALDKVWGKGRCWMGDVSYESAAYCARYVMKKQTGEEAELHYVREVDGVVTPVEPEFSLMSRKPGIGARWIEKYFADVYPHDEVVIGGKVTRPPAFYDRYLEVIDEDLLEEIKDRRVEKASAMAEHSTEARLRAREKHAHEMVKRWERDFHAD